MAIAVSALRKSKAKPLIASLAFCAVGATAAIAMDRGQFSKVPREVRDWFEHMRSPKGVLCCSYADGHRTGYDMRSILGTHRRRVVSDTARSGNQDRKSRW